MTLQSVSGARPFPPSEEKIPQCTYCTISAGGGIGGEGEGEWTGTGGGGRGQGTNFRDKQRTSKRLNWSMKKAEANSRDKHSINLDIDTVCIVVTDHDKHAIELTFVLA